MILTVQGTKLATVLTIVAPAIGAAVPAAAMFPPRRSCRDGNDITTASSIGLRPLIAQLLVVAILLGGMPLAASPVLAPHQSTPEFMPDICHPLQAFAPGAASWTLSAFTAYSFLLVIEDRGHTEVSTIAIADRVGEAPDPPPPKPLA
jgi:hypothetical protein